MGKNHTQAAAEHVDQSAQPSFFLHPAFEYKQLAVCKDNFPRPNLTITIQCSNSYQWLQFLVWCLEIANIRNSTSAYSQQVCTPARNSLGWTVS